MAAHEVLVDLVSDFSVFHRVDDVRTLPAQRFIDQAFRLSAYQGVIGALAADEQQEGHGSPSTPAPTGPRAVESTPVALVTDPVLAMSGEYAQVGEGVDN